MQVPQGARSGRLALFVYPLDNHACLWYTNSAMSKLKDWVDRRQCYPGTEDFLKGQDLLDFAREVRGNKVLLSFSCGIDSLATWLYLRENGFEVVPYTLYSIPDLGFKERVLAYYEDYFGVHIQRFPHPDFYVYLNRGIWQPPDQIAIIKALDLIWFNYADVDNYIAWSEGMDEPWCSMGMRRAENLLRLTLISQTGVMGFKNRRFFYPIWDWKIADVAGIIARHGLKISGEYEMFGCTTDRLNYRRIGIIRDRYPEDYAKILQWLPLADLEIFRYEGILYEKAED